MDGCEGPDQGLFDLARPPLPSAPGLCGSALWAAVRTSPDAAVTLSHAVLFL